jgi:hypothetical protein
VGSLRRYRAPVAVLVAALVATLLLAAFAVSSARSDSRGADAYASARPLAERVTTLRPNSIAQSDIQWRGGPITASTGETVTVRVSNAFAPEAVTPENWAEFLAKRVHGPELARLAMYIAPLSQVQQLCRGEALGCYTRNTAVSVGETLPDGTTAEEVVRHEYGHHIALYRVNTPWSAVDWGPKQWASAANVCARQARGEVFPGDEGAHYTLNPAEGWAETYRTMDERKSGFITGRWQIVDRSFYPTDAMLQAAEGDVLKPWTREQKTVHRRTLRKGQVWWIPVSTPLDGAYRITMALPRGGKHEGALVASDRRTVVKLASWARRRVRRITGNVCGQRSFFVRVTQTGLVGPVTVTVSKP